MFLLLIIGVLALTSAVTALVDVKSDGYAHHARQRTLRFS